MLTTLIADHLTTHWPPRAIKISTEATTRYAIVQKNRPNLPPNTQSRWLTLERVVAPLPPESLINHLLPQLATIHARRDQLITRYENATNDHLSSRWSTALRDDLVNQYTESATTFLNNHHLSHDPAILSDALQIFLHSRNFSKAISDAFRSRPAIEIATEMHRIHQKSSALKFLCCTYNIGHEEAVNIWRSAQNQSVTPQ